MPLRLSRRSRPGLQSRPALRHRLPVSPVGAAARPHRSPCRGAAVSAADLSLPTPKEGSASVAARVAARPAPFNARVMRRRARTGSRSMPRPMVCFWRRSPRPTRKAARSSMRHRCDAPLRAGLSPCPPRRAHAGRSGGAPQVAAHPHCRGCQLSKIARSSMIQPRAN